MGNTIQYHSWWNSNFINLHIDSSTLWTTTFMISKMKIKNESGLHLKQVDCYNLQFNQYVLFRLTVHLEEARVNCNISLSSQLFFFLKEKHWMRKSNLTPLLKWPDITFSPNTNCHRVSSKGKLSLFSYM